MTLVTVVNISVVGVDYIALNVLSNRANYTWPVLTLSVLGMLWRYIHDTYYYISTLRPWNSPSRKTRKIYLTWSRTWLVMILRSKESGHQRSISWLLMNWIIASYRNTPVASAPDALNDDIWSVKSPKASNQKTWLGYYEPRKFSA